MPGPKPKYAIELSEMQVARLTELSQRYTAPYAAVQRARMLLLAYEHPDWSNVQIAQAVGCHVDTVRTWRRRWQAVQDLQDQPRAGARPAFPALVRTQVIALACSDPRQQGRTERRWTPEILAEVAVQKQITPSISASTVRRWLRADKIKPWQYHAWQRSTDPQFVEKAGPVLDLYEQAPVLAQQGEVVGCTDEKTSIQARQPVHETKPAIPEHPTQVAARYRRRGALQLFCALLVATGHMFTRCYVGKCFVDFQRFLLAWFGQLKAQGIKVLHLILDNGPTHAPKRLGGWIATLELSFQVRLYWLPTYASWLDQVEIIFSKVQRHVLTPNDFATRADLKNHLLRYFAQINRDPKPIAWTYTRAQLLAKFGSPPVPQP